MKKAQKRFFGTALTLSTVASVVAPVAVSAATQTYEEAKAKVDAAKATPVFSLFNTAYEAVIGLKDEAKKAELLNQLAPLWDKVNTPYVKEILGQLESLAKDKNLKTYHEVLAKIEANTTEAVNKEYLKGELVAWAASGSLYTTAEKAAIDAIVKAWTDKTPASITAAKEAVAKVTSAGSLEWLNAQIAEVQATLSVSITEVKAIGAKKIEVKFNKPVDDTKAVVDVKKGSVAPSISSKTYSTDKTSVVIELAGKLTEGEYTVNVTGLADKAISGKVSVTDEKVAKITLLSDIATAVTSTTDKYTITGLKASYKALNQYGEDISKTTDILANSSAGDTDARNGEITITLRDSNIGYVRVGDKVSVSLINTDSQVSVSATLTVSNEAKVQSVEVISLYNKDNKVLDEDATATDFMLVLVAKDQYGNVIKADKIKDQVLVNVSNPTIVTVKDLAANKATFETVKIDGVDKTVLRLAAPVDGLDAGKATIAFIPTSGGSATSYEVEVKNGKKVDKITFTQPDTVVSANKTVKIPFEAFDTFGNAVTDADVLNDVTINVGGNAYTGGPAVQFKQDYVTGKAYLEVKPTSDGILTINATTATFKYSYITINVKDQAKPTTIVGFDSDAPLNALLEETFKLEAKNFIVQDQYGRVMSDDDFKASISNLKDTDGVEIPGSAKYKVIITPSDNSTAFTADKTELISGTDVATFTAASTNGTRTIQFSVKEKKDGAWKTIAGSEYEVSARAVKLSELKSYELADITTQFDELTYLNPTAPDATKDVAKYNTNFTLYGKTSDGSKVIIPSVAKGDITKNYYDVSATNSILTSLDEAGKVKTTINVKNTTGASVYAKDVDTLTTQLKVTLNHDGKFVTKDVVISKAKPVVASLEFENDTDDIRDKANKPAGTVLTKSTDGTVADGIETGAVYKVKLGAGDTTLNAGDVLPIILIKDQYGKETFLSDYTTGRFDFLTGVSTFITSVTFSDKVEYSGTSITMENNGSTTAAKVNNVAAGDTFTVTFTTDNGKTASAKIVIE